MGIQGTTGEEESPKYREWLETQGFGDPCLRGAGAFAAVYRCRDRDRGRWCACKVSGGKAGLEREAFLLEQAGHPLFPRYYDYLAKDGYACLVMEYIPGSSLASLLERRGRMTQAQAVRIGLALSRGLHALHERNEPLFFRDLKPENIMVRQDGGVKLLDLGCACTAAESLLSRAGTPGYAAPEQLGEGAVGVCSDVYAWGKVMHYMLTGKNPCIPPYPADSIRSYDKGLDGGLSRLLQECLAQDPGSRPDLRRIQRRLENMASGKPLRRYFRRPVGEEAYLVEKSLWKSYKEF